MADFVYASKDWFFLLPLKKNQYLLQIGYLLSDIFLIVYDCIWYMSNYCQPYIVPYMVVYGICQNFLILGIYISDIANC